MAGFEAMGLQAPRSATSAPPIPSPKGPKPMMFMPFVAYARGVNVNMVTRRHTIQ